MSIDISIGGPCPPDCPICKAHGERVHELDRYPHNHDLPDGIMDLCAECVEGDPYAFHYRGDWHRDMIENIAKCNPFTDYTNSALGIQYCTFCKTAQTFIEHHASGCLYRAVLNFKYLNCPPSPASSN